MEPGREGGASDTVRRLVPEGVAFLIVGAVLAVVAAVAFIVGRNILSKTDFVPEQTVETVKEDVQWAKNQARSARR